MQKILVSTCLYGGPPVRYDGKTKNEQDSRFLKWKEEGILIPICPEVFGGLDIPRPPAERNGDKILTQAGKDVTKEYTLGAKEAVRIAKENNVAFCIMKESSPSCGSKKIYDGNFTGTKISGQGLTVELLKKEGFIVFSEKDLDEIEKVIDDLRKSSL